MDQTALPGEGEQSYYQWRSLRQNCHCSCGSDDRVGTTELPA